MNTHVPHYPPLHHQFTAPQSLNHNNTIFNATNSAQRKYSTPVNALRNRRRSRGKPENVCQLLTGTYTRASSKQGSRKASYGSLFEVLSALNNTNLKIMFLNHFMKHLLLLFSGNLRPPGRPSNASLLRLNSTPSRQTHQSGPALGSRSGAPVGRLANAPPPPLRLHHSLLRSPRQSLDIVPYTPPPILSPMRHGSGLFWRLNRQLSQVFYGIYIGYYAILKYSCIVLPKNTVKDNETSIKY
jgi:hypothetical protein